MRGVSREAVRLAIKSGRLSKSVVYTDKGAPRIADTQLADKEWVANTDQSAPRNSVTGNPKRKSPPAKAKPEPKKTGKEPSAAEMEATAAAVDFDALSYADARAKRERYLAALAKLEYDEKSGKLASAEVIRGVIFNTARSARDMFMAVPDRVAPLIVGLTEQHEIHRILTDEVRRICLEVAKMQLPGPAQ